MMLMGKVAGYSIIYPFDKLLVRNSETSMGFGGVQLELQHKRLKQQGGKRLHHLGLRAGDRSFDRSGCDVFNF